MSDQAEGWDGKSLKDHFAALGSALGEAVELAEHSCSDVAGLTERLERVEVDLARAAPEGTSQAGSRTDIRRWSGSPKVKEIESAIWVFESWRVEAATVREAIHKWYVLSGRAKGIGRE